MKKSSVYMPPTTSAPTASASRSTFAPTKVDDVPLSNNKQHDQYINTHGLGESSFRARTSKKATEPTENTAAASFMSNVEDSSAKFNGPIFGRRMTINDREEFRRIQARSYKCDISDVNWILLPDGYIQYYLTCESGDKRAIFRIHSGLTETETKAELLMTRK